MAMKSATAALQRSRSRLITTTLAASLLGAVTAPGPTSAQTRDILLPPDSKVFLGVWQPAPGTVEGFEALIGHEVSSAIVYLDLSHADPGAIKAAGLGNRIPHVVVEPWSVSLKDLAAGRASATDHLRDLAKAVASLGQPVFLRFAHEMNLDHYPWGRDPAGYVQAWQTARRVFDGAGASNAVWVWSPNAWPVDYERYYPGNDYVDWIGVDFYGLKWDTGPAREKLDSLVEFSRRHGGKPVMIAETAAACGSGGAARARWIDGLFDAVEARPEVKAVFWFNERKLEAGLDTDWRIDGCRASDPDGLAARAFRSRARDPRYLGAAR